MFALVNEIVDPYLGGTMAKSMEPGGGGRFQKLVNEGKSPALVAYMGARNGETRRCLSSPVRDGVDSVPSL